MSTQHAHIFFAGVCFGCNSCVVDVSVEKSLRARETLVTKKSVFLSTRNPVTGFVDLAVPRSYFHTFYYSG